MTNKALPAAYSTPSGLSFTVALTQVFRPSMESKDAVQMMWELAGIGCKRQEATTDCMYSLQQQTKPKLESGHKSAASSKHLLQTAPKFISLTCEGRQHTDTRFGQRVKISANLFPVHDHVYCECRTRIQHAMLLHEVVQAAESFIYNGCSKTAMHCTKDLSSTIIVS